MKQRKYEKLPMDANLRTQCLRVIESYKATTNTKPEGSVPDIWADEVRPALMKSISDLIAAYDNHELSPTLQRKLFTMMRKFVAKYSE